MPSDRSPAQQTADTLALSDRLRPVLLRLARELRREARAVGVSPSQVALLGEIKYAPGVGVNELAERERMSPAAMSGHVEKLVGRGYVLRTPSDSDRRRVSLTLTEEGRRVLRNVRSRRTVWLAQRLSALTADELGALERAVEPLARVLGDEERR